MRSNIGAKMLFLRGLFLTSFLVSLAACTEKEASEERSFQVKAKDGAIKVSETHPKHDSEPHTPKAAK